MLSFANKISEMSLDHLISEEKRNCKKTRSKIKMARLERAYDAYQALHEVANWTPKLAKYQRLKKIESNIVDFSVDFS